MLIIKKIKQFRIFLSFLIIFFFILFLLSRGYIYNQKNLQYGVTFSHKQAESLGLDWQKTYLAILDDLQVKKLRLSAYWDKIEPERDRFEWDYLDWEIKEASQRNVEIILAIGGRLPRWPECHFPEWTKALDENARQKNILKYITKIINRYKDESSIRYWQVENEPFLPNFGECPPLNDEFLDKEISLVKSLDTREVMITDSGELSVWVPAAKRADVFGTTMYSDVYSQKLKSYIHYPLEPGFFRFKKNIARFFAHPRKWIVIELQAEPWGPIPFQYLSSVDRARTMDLSKFKKIIEFARQAGFREFYLWGAEWWYWEKTVQHNDSLWQEAKNLYLKK